ncbi:hypothetical protein CUJ89_35920 [Burkholderia pyrrocinia]|uniref:Awr type III effector family protein n=1 Tax=Burkholderia pyrrocinia TaxID=60550 RepID=A0A2Z5N899_BURPY|nr:hypothetical protein [Burkholderia pyrrocinia]AXF25803.1 hypothetical protein CUJ89_35920 [Burkholderia pyrrocinia]
MLRLFNRSSLSRGTADAAAAPAPASDAAATAAATATAAAAPGKPAALSPLGRFKRTLGVADRETATLASSHKRAGRPLAPSVRARVPQADATAAAVPAAQRHAGPHASAAPPDTAPPNAAAASSSTPSVDTATAADTGSAPRIDRPAKPPRGAAKADSLKRSLFARAAHAKHKPPAGAAPNATPPAGAAQVPHGAAAFRAAARALFADDDDAPAARDALLDRLAAFAPRTDAMPDAPFGRPLLAAQTLAVVAHGNAAAALRALDYVEHDLDFAPTTPGAPPPTPDADGDVWFDASDAPHTDTDDDAEPVFRDAASAFPNADDTRAAERAGWQAAQLLSHSDDGFAVLTDLVGARLPAASRDTARALLQAADQLRAAGGDATLPADFAHTPVATGDARASLAARTAAAAARRLRGDPAQPHDAGTLFAWRQGYRDDGKHGLLARTAGRLAKFTRRTIPRVEKRSGTSRLWGMLAKKKSPLSGLAFGTQGAQLGTLDKEAAKRDSALRAAAAALADHLDASAAHATGARASERAARTAMLRHWAGDSTNANADANAPEAGALAPDAELFDAWLRESALAHAPSAAAAARAIDAVRAVDTARDTRPDAMTVDDVKRLFRDFLEHGIESAGKLKLSDGGQIELSTRGVSTSLQHVAHGVGFPLSIRLDLRIGGGRHASVEVGRGGQGIDIFVGTQRSVGMVAGAGVTAGYDFKGRFARLRASAGASVVPVDVERTEPAGVVLRAPRRMRAPIDDYADWAQPKYDDDAMKRTIGELSDFLFEQAGRAQSPEQLWEALAARYGDERTVSIGWIDTVQRESKAHVAIDAGVGVRVSGKHTPVRIGPSAELSYETTLHASQDGIERAGTHRVETHHLGGKSRMKLRYGLGAGVGEKFGKVTQGLTSATPLSRSHHFFANGQTAKLQLATAGTTLVDRACYADLEYHSADAFVATVEHERAQWLDMLARRAGSDPARAEADLDAFVATLREIRQPNQLYLHRRRLRPAVAREIEQHRALADLQRRLGHADAAAALDAREDALLAAPESWLPQMLAVREQQSVSKKRGFAAMFRLQGATASTGQRELVNLKFG